MMELQDTSRIHKNNNFFVPLQISAKRAFEDSTLFVVISIAGYFFCNTYAPPMLGFTAGFYVTRLLLDISGESRLKDRCIQRGLKPNGTETYAKEYRSQN